MFLLKKIAGLLLSPLTVCISFLVLGVFLLLFKKKEKLSKLIIVLAVIFLISISYNILPDSLLEKLEYKYHSIQNSNLTSDIRWIVVLGGGCISDPSLPATSRLSSESLFRLVEGISIHNRVPKSKMIFSGGGAFDTIPESKVMADAALALGINKDKIVEEPAGIDTQSQALLIKKIVGNDKFVLVTSAFHMPRSMAMFLKAGLQPIPAPAGHIVKRTESINLFMFFPDSTGIKKTELAVHEYFGLLWAKTIGQI